MRKTYTNEDNILFVLQPKENKIFKQDTLDIVEQLTAKAWEIPFAVRVDSIANFQNTRAEGDHLLVDDLVRDAVNLADDILRQKESIALAEPLLKDNLIDRDADTTGVNVTFQFPGKTHLEVLHAVEKARAIKTDIQTRFPNIKIVLTGGTMLDMAFFESAQRDTLTLFPLVYATLTIVMLLCLKSVSATLVTLSITLFSVMITMGAIGYWGIELTPISGIAPTVILSIAIADSIHLIISIQKAMRKGKDKIAAIHESVRVNLLPVTITSLTTTIGFLGLNFSDSPPFSHLGNIAAIGIIAAWLLSLILLPALTSLCPIKPSKQRSSFFTSEKLFDRLTSFLVKHYRMTLALFGTFTIILSLFSIKLELNDEWIKYFDRRIAFRNDTEFAIENLRGIYQLDFSIKANESGGISDPDYLRHLERFTHWLREQPEITHVYSYTDIIKRLNKNMHADDPDWYRIPEDRQLAAQYLLIYELSLPFGLDLNKNVNIDKSATKISAVFPEISTIKVRALIKRSENWLIKNTPEYMWTKPTSGTVMFAYISKRNIDSMFKGNIIAITLIAIIIMGTLRSFKIGFLSLIPNGLPILFIFGVWSLFFGSLGMAAAVVSLISLGIIVDDTVHFLSKYLRARREEGLSKPEAIRSALHSVGTAIIITTVILVTGFSILSFSSFLVSKQQGLFVTMTISSALIFDLFLLPSILLIGHKKIKKSTLSARVMNKKRKEVYWERRAPSRHWG